MKVYTILNRSCMLALSKIQKPGMAKRKQREFLTVDGAVVVALKEMERAIFSFTILDKENRIL